MSQNAVAIPTTPPLSGVTLVNDINDAFDTIITNHSGASAPGSPNDYQLWWDTTNNKLKIYLPASAAWVEFALHSAYKGALTGMGTAYVSTTTFSVATGSCRTQNQYNATMTGSLTKSLSAWVVGTGNGSLDTGSIQASKSYHIYAVRKDSDATVDIVISLSATGPAMPAGYSEYRRIGSIRTNSSSQIINYAQIGTYFFYDAVVTDSSSVPGATKTLYTISTPTGIEVEAILGFYFGANAGAATVIGVYPSVGAATGMVYAAWAGTGLTGAYAGQCLTNLVNQVAFLYAGAVPSSFQLYTAGWNDYQLLQGK